MFFSKVIMKNIGYINLKPKCFTICNDIVLEVGRSEHTRPFNNEFNNNFIRVMICNKCLFITFILISFTRI